MTSSGNSDGLEVGMIVAWTLVTDPSDSYLECNGQSVDNSKYPKLYALMHNVPDYRGVFLRGLGGNSATLGELQGDAIRNITGTISITSPNNRDFQLFGEETTSSGALGLNNYTYRRMSSDSDRSGNTPSAFSFDASRVVPTASENRPINKAIRYFIKAK